MKGREVRGKKETEEKSLLMSMKKHNTFKAMVQPLVEIRISLQMQSCAQIKMVETTELRLVRLE